MKIITLLFCLVISFTAFSQVEVNGPLKMTGTNEADRQVKNVGDPTDSLDAVNSKTFQSGTLIFATASGLNDLSLNLTPGISNYNAGLIINFESPNINTGAMTINVNNLGVRPIVKSGQTQIDSAEIISGQLVSAIYDGTNFQVLSKLNKRCPSGFADITKDYCIELNMHDTTTFWLANKICGDIDSRLCTMGEWAAACQKATATGIIGMTTNYEWVDSAGNKPSTGHTAKTMGKLSTGVPGCNNGYVGLPTANKNFRCCFSK